MYALIVAFHIVASLVLILVVLLQSGKAGDLAATFGSTGSQTAFGARGAASVLTRATTVAAVVFMATSLTLAILFTKGSSGTVLEGIALPEEVPVELPIDPATVPAEQPATEEPASEQPLEPAAEEGSTESP
jgi:preprotein translocase subunit SecG